MVDYFLGRSRLNTLLMLILIATLTLITVQSLNGQDGSAFIVALAGLVFVGIAEWIFEPLRNLSDEAWPEDVGILAIEDLAGLEEISTTTREQLARIHSGAFPKEERQYEMAEMLDKIGRRDSLFRLITEDGDAVGYIFMEFAQDPRYGFLWYFAIDPLRRNLDIGEKALANTIERLRQTHPDLKYLLFEVHASRATTDDRAGPDLYDRLRMFYRRSGAYLVRGIDYQIPAAGQDLNAKKRASEPIEYVAYHPMFFALADEIDLAEIRAGVLLMAADEYTDIKDDDTWRSMAADTEIVIVPPPVYLTPAADSD
jgi:ribosomal protein S18 acetylase RimI-like enzyme